MWIKLLKVNTVYFQYLLVKDDVTMQSPKKFPGSSSVEVQRRQRVASSTSKH